MARISSRTLGILMVFVLITGCNVTKSEKDQTLFGKVDEMQHQIEQDQWDKLQSNLEEFEAKYKRQKWKMQLLGEHGDYQGIELEIEQMKESVKERDRLESKLGLRKIKHHMTLIYNL